MTIKKKQPVKKQTTKKPPVKKRKLPPDPEQMNLLRAAAAYRALEYFADDFGESWKRMDKKTRVMLQMQNLSDLLADLAHLCDREGFDFQNRLHVAENHYHEETGRKGKQLPAPPVEFAEHSAPLSTAATELKQAIAAWRKAGEGDSGDAEIDAGTELASLAESYLRSIAAMPAPLPAPAFDASELATVLHGLRIIQEIRNGVTDGCQYKENENEPCEHIPEDSRPLDNAAIDRLCERLNFAATAPEPEAITLYRKLADGMSDMVEGSRLTEDAIPDDYAWLVDLLTKIAGTDPEPTVKPNSAPTASSAPHLLAVCQSTLTALDNMTTDAFSKGGDKALRDGLRAAIAAHPAKPEIVIEVQGGNAEVRGEDPSYADIRIVDWDAFASGDNTLIGENAVNEELCAWLEENEPEWYKEQIEREADLGAQRAAPPAPMVSSKAKIKTYPAIIGGKSVRVTIPESNADAPDSAPTASSTPHGDAIAALNATLDLPTPEQTPSPQTPHRNCPGCVAGDWTKGEKPGHLEGTFQHPYKAEAVPIDAAPPAPATSSPHGDGKAVWEKDMPPLSAEVIDARAGVLPHDPLDDEPEAVTVSTPPDPNEEAYRKAAKKIHHDEGTLEIDDAAVISKSDEPDADGAYVQAWVWVSNEEAGIAPIECSEEGCATMVNPEDPYFATPCGTYCSVHMRQHMKSCEVCRNEFTD